MFRNILSAGFLLLLFLSSCNITKHIGEEEQLLVENKIVFDKTFKIENKKTLKNEMITLYKQVPNRPMLKYVKNGGAKLFIWLKNTEADTINETKTEKSIRKLAMKRLAEPPSIFDESLMEATRINMEFFLHNRGYFDAVVEATTYSPPEGKRKQRISKKIEITYHVKPKRQYLIDSVYFISKDAEVHDIINRAARKTYLRRGNPIEGRLYDLEKTRLTNLLRNNGYGRFTSNYIAPLEGDTTNFGAKIKVEILTPGKGMNHKKYIVGDVTIAPAYNPTLNNRRDSMISDYNFIKDPESEFWVKPKLLKDKIYFKKGEIFNQKKIDKTNRKLSDLGVYQFVNIRQSVDLVRDDLVHFDILLTPRKKYETGYDLEPNRTDRNFTTNRIQLVGFSTGLYLGDKNTFRGAEILSSNLFAGFEFNLNPTSTIPLLNTIDLKTNFDLTIPRFNDYLGIYKFLRKSKLIRKPFYENLKENARTKVPLGYNFISLFGLYDSHDFNVGYGYDLQDRNRRFIINNLGIDILRPDFKANFLPVLQNNDFLRNSFGDQLFSGFLFRDFSYFFNSNSNKFGERHFYQLNVEVSGSEVFAVNKIYNLAADNQDTLRLGNAVTGLEFSQYAKFDFNVGYSRKFDESNSVAVRFSGGIGSPFGYSSDLPYLKQFYSGGPQSIRGWPARGIGPGSYRDPLTLDPENRLRFYQTGDFKLEFNAEYRFFLFNFFADVEGAFFIDAGNVWTLQNDPSRPGSQLVWNKTRDTSGKLIDDNFFNEMAIGSGVGFRFDFSFFLLRLDLGYPVKNNYRTTLASGEESYLFHQNWRSVSTRFINYNLGFNYPF